MLDVAAQSLAPGFQSPSVLMLSHPQLDTFPSLGLSSPWHKMWASHNLS